MTRVQCIGREDADENPAIVQYGQCPPQVEQPVYGTAIPIAQNVQAGHVGVPVCNVSPTHNTGFPCSPSGSSRSLCPDLSLRSLPPRRPSVGAQGPQSSPPAVLATSMCMSPPPVPYVFGNPASSSATPHEHSRQSSTIHDPDTADGASCGSVRRERTGEDVVVVVQFKWGRLGDFKSNLPLTVGTAVLVEADRGTDLGMVQSIDTQGNPEDVEWRVIRAATRKEQDKWQRQLVTREQAARKKAQTIVEEGGLDIQIQHAEYQFDKKKLTFHYTSAEARPNFRTVLDELFAVFRCRVWFARYSGEALERDRTNKELVSKRKQVRKMSAPPEESRSDNSSLTGPSTSPMEEDMTVTPFPSPH